MDRETDTEVDTSVLISVAVLMIVSPSSVNVVETTEVSVLLTVAVVSKVETAVSLTVVGITVVTDSVEVVTSETVTGGSTHGQIEMLVEMMVSEIVAVTSEGTVNVTSVVTPGNVVTVSTYSVETESDI